jgi:hypothetical protein
LRDRRITAQRGVLQDEHTPFGFGCSDEPTCFHHMFADIRIAPVRRHHLWAWRRWNEGAEDFPQRRHVEAVDMLVEPDALFQRTVRHGCCLHVFSLNQVALG